MTEVFERKEYFPKSTSRTQLEKNCETHKLAGAVSCKIQEDKSGWVVTSTWNSIQPNKSDTNANGS